MVVIVVVVVDDDDDESTTTGTNLVVTVLAVGVLCCVKKEMSLFSFILSKLSSSKVGLHRRCCKTVVAIVGERFCF